VSIECNPDDSSAKERFIMKILFVLLLGLLAFVEILEPPATAPKPATWTGVAYSCPDGTRLWKKESEALMGKQYVYCVDR
jgi:hypothetical protein